MTTILNLLLFFQAIGITYQLQAPTDSPGAGLYSGTQSVTLSESVSGSTICYTNNGSTPTASAGTCTAGTTYSGAISTAATTTYKFLASKAGYSNSAVVTSTYTISSGTTLLTHGGFSLGANGGTSTALDTTGATCIVVSISGYYNASTVLSDSQGGGSNSYTGLNHYDAGAGSGTTQIFYTAPTKKGTGHTWTLSGSTSVYLSLYVEAWSGLTCSPQAMTDLGTHNTGTSISPGSVSPSGSYVVITAFTSDTTQGGNTCVAGVSGVCIDSSMTISDELDIVGGASFNGGMAYKATSSVTNPTWTLKNSGNFAGAIVVME